MDDLPALRRDPTPPRNASCGLRAALDVVAGKWKPLILWWLLDGPMRCAELRRGVGDVAEKVFVEQLRQLEDDGVLIRTVEADKPLAVSYRLSERGARLAPVLAALSLWGWDEIVTPAISGRTI